MSRRSVFSSTQRHIIAIVPTFDPDCEFPARIDELAGQVDRVVVGVDAWTRAKANVLQGFVAENISFVQEAENIGIAAILNRCVEASGANDEDLLLFLDDDSVLGPGFVDAYLTACLRWSLDEVSGIFGPGIVNVGAFCPWPAAHSKGDERCFSERLGVISSGMLLCRGLFDQIGGWDESYFIDCVDFEFCLRGRRLGIKTVQCLDVRMLHQLGESRFVSFGFLRLQVTFHSPLRRRYYFRNSTRLAVRSLFSCPKYSIGVVVSQARALLGIVLVEDDKARKLKACFAGYLDFLSGRFGIIEVG